MNRRTLIYTGIVAALGLATVVTASTAYAGNGDLVKNPIGAKMKANNATLAIKSPAGNVCPGQAKLSVFFRATKKGKITFLLVRDKGQVSGPYTVQTKKYGNEYRASYSKSFNVLTPVNTRYRAVVTHSDKKGSRWVPLKASC